MPSRAGHHKSRHGCETCKRRKVRCSLDKPICAHCQRLELECFYSDVGSATPPVGKTGTRTFQDKATSTNEPYLGDGSMAAHDLELMHHYSVSTYRTMSDEPKIQSIWQTAVPKDALAHPFLMRGLLSLSALHIHDSSSVGTQDSPYLSLAASHHERALASYIPHLQNITPINCHALFAYSQVIAPVSCGFLLTTSKHNNHESVIHAIVQLFELLVGAVAIAYKGRHWLRQGHLVPMMHPIPSKDVSVLADEVRKALQALCEDAKAHNDASAYLAAIQTLSMAFPDRDGTLPQLSAVIAWPVFLDVAFVAALKRREPMTLVVLAYYGVALQDMKNIWWLNGLGKNLVQAIAASVEGNRYQAHLEWAIKRV